VFLSKVKLFISKRHNILIFVHLVSKFEMLSSENLPQSNLMKIILKIIEFSSFYILTKFTAEDTMPKMLLCIVTIIFVEHASADGSGMDRSSNSIKESLYE